jgi:hypothetical protein
MFAVLGNICKHKNIFNTEMMKQAASQIATAEIMTASNMYDFKKVLKAYFKKLPQITNYQHFATVSSSAKVSNRFGEVEQN